MPRSVMSALPLLILAACASAGSAPLMLQAELDRTVATPDAGGNASGLGGVQLAQAPAYRKLIRTGQLSVAVDAYDPFARDLDLWLSEHGGFVADTNLSRYEGHIGYASLRVRVPADQLDTLVGWTRERVEVEHLSVTTQDVTSQWVDQDARLAAMRSTEQRLLQLMAEQTGSLADVLAAERELSRIRSDIESLERQHRALQDQVHLASLTLDVRVRDPLTSHVSQTLGAEAADALSTSLSLMAGLGRGLVIVAVAAAPWLALAAMPLLLLALMLRRLVRRSR